jgi:hypothetical protein
MSRDRGREIYLIGNGPSLRDVDMSLLKNKDTISFNRAYISYEEWGFNPTYYMVIDPNLFCSIIDDINDLIEKSDIKKFFFNGNHVHKEHRGECSMSEIVKSDKVEMLDIVNSHKFLNIETMEYNLHKQKWVVLDNLKIGKVSYMSTVGLCSLQVLYNLGYNTVYLLGCDMNYTTDIDETEEITKSLLISTGSSDPNHYRLDYFSEGIKYGTPNNKELVKRWIESKPKIDLLENFEVISLTPNSELNKFINFEEPNLYK